ncbi:MAG: M23 family metallopeptidase [Gaiellaceae bacterium]
MPLIRRIKVLFRHPRSYLYAAALAVAVATLAAIGFVYFPSGGGREQARDWAPYEWPIKPFNRPHPIRGNLDDPRLTKYRDGRPGSFSFHSGVDISAPGGTAVYAVAAGHVCTLGGAFRGRPTTVGVCGRGFEFVYRHVGPVVERGQRLAEHQLLGYVLEKWGHVHLGEMWDERTWNPLRAGALTPYHDESKPTIVSIELYRHGRYLPAAGAAVAGRVDLVVSAFDTPELKSSWPWARVTPALIRWRLLSEASGKALIPTRTSLDFRLRKLKREPAKVFAPGTLKNTAKRAGVYNFWLVRGLGTSRLQNGGYRLVVLVSDSRGNTARKTVRLTVRN